MGKIIVYLVVGLFVGYRGLIPQRFRALPGKITTIGLISLLVFMGATLGGNANLMENISILGFQAFLLALAAIIGSVLFVFGVNQIMKLVRPSTEQPAPTDQLATAERSSLNEVMAEAVGDGMKKGGS